MCQVAEFREPLIGSNLVSSTNGEDNDEAAAMRVSQHKYIHGFLQWLPPASKLTEELQLLGRIACPIVMTSLVLYSRSIISMLFLGRLGDLELAGGSLAIGVANITGYSLIKGLSMGMEPICCQAFGAKRLSVIAQTYQKTLCLLLLSTIPISLLWLNIKPILLALGQDQGIITIAQVYLTFSIPELIAEAYLHPLRSFLRTQSMTRTVSVAATCALILHLPINYFLATYLNLGVKGVALATAWSTINLNVCLLVMLVLKKAPLKPWHGASFLSTFQGWRPLLALALPSACSVCLEWWCYEIMLLLSGLLKDPQASVAAMSILIQMTGFLYVFPHSLSLGLSTRVGHELGAGRPSHAQWTTVVGLLLAFGFGLSALAFTVAVRSFWGSLFTSDPKTLALTSVAIPMVGLCELGNSPQTAACGVLTGSARPNIGARINFGSFYLVGLPVSIVMGFTLEFGFVGILFGLVAAQASCVAMMAYTLITTDWRHQAKRAEKLTKTDDSENDDLEARLMG